MTRRGPGRAARTVVAVVVDAVVVLVSVGATAGVLEAWPMLNHGERISALIVGVVAAIPALGVVSIVTAWARFGSPTLAQLERDTRAHNNRSDRAA